MPKPLSLDETIKGVLALLPADGSEIEYPALYEQATQQFPGVANAALRELVKDRRRGMLQRVVFDDTTKKMKHFVKKGGA